MHFKGSEKPWRHPCRRQAERGRLVRLDGVNATPPFARNPLLAEGVEWDGAACVARASRSPVLWEHEARGPTVAPASRSRGGARLAVSRRCCTVGAMLVAEWYAMGSLEQFSAAD